MGGGGWEVAGGEKEKELEPTRTSLVAFVTPDLKSGLSPNLRTYRGIKCVSSRRRRRLTTLYPLEVSYIIAFMAKHAKHPVRTSSPARRRPPQLCPRALGRGQEGRTAPSSPSPGPQGGVLPPAGRLLRSPWTRTGGWRELRKCRRGNGGSLETSRSGTPDGLLGGSSAFLSNLEPVIPSACTESSTSDHPPPEPGPGPVGVTAASLLLPPPSVRFPFGGFTSPAFSSVSCAHPSPHKNTVCVCGSLGIPARQRAGAAGPGRALDNGEGPRPRAPSGCSTPGTGRPAAGLQTADVAALGPFGLNGTNTPGSGKEGNARKGGKRQQSVPASGKTRESLLQ